MECRFHSNKYTVDCDDCNRIAEMLYDNEQAEQGYSNHPADDTRVVDFDF